jgi:hypothetical protein
VKGKVVEAMARGVPVATTPVGAQGLDGASLFIGADAGDFARADRGSRWPERGGRPLDRGARGVFACGDGRGAEGCSR